MESMQIYGAIEVEPARTWSVGGICARLERMGGHCMEQLGLTGVRGADQLDELTEMNGGVGRIEHVNGGGDDGTDGNGRWWTVCSASETSSNRLSDRRHDKNCELHSSYAP